MSVPLLKISKVSGSCNFHLAICAQWKELFRPGCFKHLRVSQTDSKPEPLTPRGNFKPATEPLNRPCSSLGNHGNWHGLCFNQGFARGDYASAMTASDDLLMTLPTAAPDLSMALYHLVPTHDSLLQCDWLCK
jgi:hypothetical protein